MFGIYSKIIQIMKVMCIFHSRDLDGWVSGAVVKKWCEENNHEIELVGYDYGQDVPLDKIGATNGEISCDALFICDVSFPKDTMQGLYEQGVNMIWCDHHKSALEDANGMEYNDCDGIRNMDYAGCELTWQYCYPDEDMPMGVEFLGKYDTFRHKNDSYENEILNFQYAARTHITDADNVPSFITAMDGYSQEISEWVDEGEIILAYLKTEAQEIYKKHKFDVVIDGFKFVCIPKERFNPINFDIDYHEDGYDGSICFWFKGQDSVWEFSIYNENGKIDCAELAKKRGGGGHAAAAGFTIKDINDIIGEPDGRES